MANGSGVYEVGEFENRQLVNLPKQNSSTKAECLIVSPNLINTLLAVCCGEIRTNFKTMKEQDILKIVEETFSEEIYAEGWLDWGTPMATLCGKEAFMKELENRLKKLFDDNDLSK